MYSSANARSIDDLLKSAEDLPVRQPLRMTTRVPTRRAKHVLDRLVSIGWIRNESRFTHLERQAVLDDRLMQEERDRRRWLQCIVPPPMSNANVASSLSPSSCCSRSEYASSTCVAIEHPFYSQNLQTSYKIQAQKLQTKPILEAQKLLIAQIKRFWYNFCNLKKHHDHAQKKVLRHTRQLEEQP